MAYAIYITYLVYVYIYIVHTPAPFFASSELVPRCSNTAYPYAPRTPRAMSARASKCPMQCRWQRPVAENEDPTKANKLSKRFNDGMATAINPEPQQIDPRALGVSSVNRLFSIQHVHCTILQSMVADGHDESRPSVGICVEVRDKKALEKLIRHNQNLAATSPLMPKVYAELIRYECLASTHYNVSLRLGKDGHSTPAGDLSKLKNAEPSYKEACERGHWWIILPESTSEDLKADICTWRNQDQNENQPITDGELVRLAKNSVEDYMSKAPAGVKGMPLALIVTATCLKSPLRLNPSVVGGFCRWVCQMYEESSAHMVNWYMDTWSGTVDPKLMTIPHGFFEGLSKCDALKGKPDVRMYLVIAMYAPEAVISRTRPSPDSCALFTLADLAVLSKTPFVVDLVQKTLETLRRTWLPFLGKHLAAYDARAEVNAMGVLLVRAMCGKKLKCTWAQSVPVCSGKLTDIKVNALLGFWCKHLDTECPTIEFGKVSGLDKHHPVVSTHEPMDDRFDVLRGTSRITKKQHLSRRRPVRVVVALDWLMHSRDSLTAPASRRHLVLQVFQSTVCSAWATMCR